jgi:hypothetical protein
MTKKHGETETETTDTRVAGTAGPAVLLAFAAGRNSDYQRRSARLVLNLGVLSSSLLASLYCSARSWDFSLDCPAVCASIASHDAYSRRIGGKAWHQAHLTVECTV